jgi:hypothetical protein
VSCWTCQREAVLSADRWSDDVAVCRPSGRAWFGAGCGIIGADARPNWKEQPPRETLTGVQWRS